MRHIAILGFGREGKSVLKFLKRSSQFKKARIEILDKKQDKNYLKNLSRFDLIFRSPGVPYNLPELKKARARGVKFGSATKLFFDHCPAQIIGITGTKGKGTTATLLCRILKAAHKSVFLAGNIGTSPLEILPKLKKNDLVVLELSSFQLQDLHRSPHIAVILDIFPDHLDAHLNLPEYYSAKARIVRYQKRGDMVFFFSAKSGSASGGKNNRVSSRIAKLGKGRKIEVDERRFKLFAPDKLKIKGEHNFKNAAMAATVARRLGIPDRIIRRVAMHFHGMEHRLELVRTITLPLKPRKSHSYVLKNIRMRFYNDSASTNPQTTVAAIKAFPNGPKILIAGGQDKGLDYRPLGKALSARGGSAFGGKNSRTELVVLFGENKKEIASAIKNSGARIKIVPNLERAVSLAYRSASLMANGYTLMTILFSPGAASFDQFKNYADRGKKFKKAVRDLIKK